VYPAIPRLVHQEEWLPGSNPLPKLSLFFGTPKSGEIGFFVLTESIVGRRDRNKRPIEFG
jgi:hypothetical protein